jgi:hypothetical protein
MTLGPRISTLGLITLTRGAKIVFITANLEYYMTTMSSLSELPTLCIDTILGYIELKELRDPDSPIQQMWPDESTLELQRRERAARHVITEFLTRAYNDGTWLSDCSGKLDTVPFKLNYKPTPGGLNSSETSRAGEPARLESGVVPTPLSVPRHSEAQSLASEEAQWAYNRVSTVSIQIDTIFEYKALAMEIWEQICAAETNQWAKVKFLTYALDEDPHTMTAASVYNSNGRNYNFIFILWSYIYH